jgi:co-chaperonin GroES (HSP10)
MIGQRVVVRVDKKYQDEIDIGNGQKLYLDPSWKPEEHVTICGEVVAIPNSKWCKTFTGDFIENELYVGDLIYFNYLTVDPTNLIPGEKNLYTVDLEMIFCYVRGGRITATSNHALIKPIRIKQPMRGKIYLSTPNSGVSKNRGVVKYLSPPKKNSEKPEIARGDEVWFHERNAFENEIEGKKYYVMQQDIIEGKIYEAVDGGAL